MTIFHKKLNTRRILGTHLFSDEFIHDQFEEETK